MKVQERADFIEKFLNEHCRAVMQMKGTEYSRGEDDCNSNFKRVAEAIGLMPIQVAYTYMAKHWDSLSTFVRSNGQVPLSEPLEERIGDMVNYLLIFASLLEEVKEDRPKSKRVPKPPSEGFLPDSRCRICGSPRSAHPEEAAHPEEVVRYFDPVP